MITKKVKALRKKYDKERGLAEMQTFSDDIYNELIDNCKPTLEEFKRLTSGLIGTSSMVYRMAMDARDNWK